MINKDNIIKEIVKQKMQLKPQRLRRYEKRNKLYHQNLIFRRDVKKLYRETGKETITVDDAPLIEEIEDF